jgi:hypothetical protein
MHRGVINTQPRVGMPYEGVPGRSVNASRLERWLGKDQLARVSESMRDWYGPPIALHGVPGKVFAHGGGDFRGELRAGYEMSAKDKALDLLKRMRRASRRVSKANRLQFNTGFASLSDLISEATAGGKRREFKFQKVGTTGVVGFTNTLWFVGNSPAAGAAAAAPAGGTAWTDASTGGHAFTNPDSGDTQHFVMGGALASVVANTALLYDRLFSVTFTIGITTQEAVTGVPTRYQSTTGTAADYIGGNFLMPEIRTVLPATAHNLTVCTYLDQDNAASTLPSVTGLSGGIVNRLDTNLSTWFLPLATGDIGAKAITAIQKSAVLASGAIDMTLGHPIAWMPCPIANMVCQVDGINTAFNLARIFDDACLSLIEVNKPATGATTYVVNATTVAG